MGRPPADVAPAPDPTPAGPPRLDATVEWEASELFGEIVRERLDDGYSVRNPNLVAKAWNNLTNWDWSRGGQCGDFAEWGVTWSRDVMTEHLGEGTLVDVVTVESRSSANPQGIADSIHARFVPNHAETLV